MTGGIPCQIIETAVAALVCVCQGNYPVGRYMLTEKAVTVCGAADVFTRMRG